jgi:hypothetical protein
LLHTRVANLFVFMAKILETKDVDWVVIWHMLSRS